MKIRILFNSIFLSFNLLVTMSIFAVEIEYGDKYKRYSFNSNVESDFVKYFGEYFKDGFGAQMSPYIYPGCLLKTIPIVEVGQGKIRAEVEFYSSQSFIVENLSELRNKVLFLLVASWEYANSVHETRYIATPSAYLGRVSLISQAEDGRQFYFLETSGFEPPLVTPEYSFDGSISNLTVSVCNLMYDTSVSVRKIILTVLQDQ